MGCVSSNLLNQKDEFTQLGTSGLGHHIVSLTSTTYGLLTLDSPPQSTTTPPIPSPPFTQGSAFNDSKSLWSEPRPFLARPEVINSWELMSGLDADSFHFSPVLNKVNSNTIFSKSGSLPKPPMSLSSLLDKFQAESFRFPNTSPSEKESADPNLNKKSIVSKLPFSGSSLRHKFDSGNDAGLKPSPLDKFEHICPPNGENRVVIYTTTLRGIRKTFEDCNAVRSAIESYGIAICERDISMDRGLREELKELMKGKEKESTNQMTPPQVFIKGRYIGGAEQVVRIVDEGLFGDLLTGLPKKSAGEVCDGCGDAKFLPCFQCSGSCKMEVVAKAEGSSRMVMVRCTECNENGLMHCPICS